MEKSEFIYKRKYYVKDLLNPYTLITNSNFIEFDSFQEFVKVVLKDNKIPLLTDSKFIIPVESADEVELIESINPDLRSFLVLKLNSFNKELRDSFKINPNIALLIESSKIDELKQEIIDNPSDNFIKFINTTYGYFLDDISITDIDNIMYKFTDPYFKFPFFCISLIRWNWESFQDLKVKDLNKLFYQCRLISKNYSNCVRSINYSTYLADKTINLKDRDYRYDRMRCGSCKWIYVKDGNLYIDSPDSGMYINMYNEEYSDANKVDFKEINKLRLPFDIKLDNKYAHDLGIVSISQNIKCTGNPAIIPYLCLLVGTILSGGRI